MQPIRTLDEFFQRSGASVSFYHMGRRVTACSDNALRQLENAQSPWPAPWQSQARVAIVFRLGDMPEPAIWFLALPLDEEGHLVPAQRDAFLNRLIETLGRNVSQLGQERAPEVDNLMKDNPLAFTPSAHFQAMLNARATYDLKLPASQHFEPVVAYLRDPETLDWQQLGLQGIADVVIRMDNDIAERLATQLAYLPTEVAQAFCLCLEHQALTSGLVAALRRRGEQAIIAGDLEMLCACVRAVGATVTHEAGNWYTQLLRDETTSGPDVLAAMAGRGWPHLEDGERLPLFLSRLADDERTDFIAVVRDLALIPRLRLPILMALRDAPDGSTIHARVADLSARSGQPLG
ncbi:MULTISPECIES: DUF3549 family protein [unclassified Halomonas]|uniref:DUF3549 family protein n=1 Tax=unclassified Halomonas TaxID=2609666 RepID=UPI0006DB8F3A|nr:MULTISPECIES: DUF3549 family protein [unclassified Halomonas]KPQ21114.1 MAG: protein of unknown function DUF3549 [Halomonas sp. HL-93]SBR47897.1 Protein of unknown function (DUF3549) [Halomonas sp. HL-93]SNY95660.1 Protein of unknown function [Halomonas sp. hl-4]